MAKKKTIWDYFRYNISYPREVAHNSLPYGTVWCFISSTFLNGIVNYVKPISCFVLDRYTSCDKNISNRGVSVRNKGEFGKWHKWHGTKKELITAIISGEKEMYHTNMDCFGDDITLLAEIETDEKDNKGRYMFFWFDSDISDCCIGKFETTDNKEDVIQSMRNWLDEDKEENRGVAIEDGYDNGIVNYSELPISFLKGWVKF
jgi:hypothetical protein